MLTTIYKATCKATGLSYIGQTSRTLSVRRGQHEREAKRGRKCPKFHSALRKYGENAFVWRVVARVPPEWGNAAEEVAIVQHGTLAPNGYNLREGGNVRGFSDETRAKLSAAGKNRSQEHRANLAAAATGKTQTAKARAKVSAARKGKPWTAARRAAQNNKNGKHH